MESAPCVPFLLVLPCIVALLTDCSGSMFAYLRIIADSCWSLRINICLLANHCGSLPSSLLLTDRSGSILAYLPIIADSCWSQRINVCLLANHRGFLPSSPLHTVFTRSMSLRNTNNSLAAGFCRWIHDCPLWQRVPSQKFLLLLWTMFGSPSHLASVPDVPSFAFLAAPPWSRR